MHTITKATRLSIEPVRGIPMVAEGDNLAALIKAGFDASDIVPRDGDILVVTQKIVSKAEGRLVHLSSVTPTEMAKKVAARTMKDARHVQVILDQSNEVVRVGPRVIVTEHLLGHVVANAGVDVSNIEHDGGCEEAVLCLPEDPDLSARVLRKTLERECSAAIGVIISDSAGRAWRKGVIGMAIGVSGVPALVDMRGQKDLFGRELRVTEVAVADQLACAANLVMGEAGEALPVALIRGFKFTSVDSSAADLLRPKSEDLFR